MPLPLPRPRTSEMPQKLSQRGVRHVRTSSCDSDPLHRRTIVEKNIKALGDRRMVKSGPLNQRKLGSRISDLESQLEQAQKELKNLKYYLDSAKAPMKQDHDHEHRHSGRKGTRKLVTADHSSPTGEEYKHLSQPPDIFEVPTEKKLSPAEVDAKANAISINDPEKTKLIQMPGEPAPSDELVTRNDLQINHLLPTSELEEKEKALNAISHDNEHLKKLLDATNAELAATRARGEEMASKLVSLEQNLESSKVESVQLKAKFENIETTAAGKEAALELELKQLRVQTEQWRKAADAAAAVLAEGGDRLGSERCDFVDKNLSNGDCTCRYSVYLDTSSADQAYDDRYNESTKKKSAGMHMFGDLWRKKGQK